jgi:hypothetical protein
MSEEHILRYTDLAAVIQMAKARGWSTMRIVRTMSSGLAYADALKLARKAAPLLDITVAEFMRLRKNEWESSVLQLREQTFTVAIFAKLVVINAAFFFQHVTLERPQQIFRGAVEQFGFGFRAPFRRRFHANSFA